MPQPTARRGKTDRRPQHHPRHVSASLLRTSGLAGLLLLGPQ
ncbi:hypothetical protein [Ornithinimicrobium kibberense]